MSYIIEQNKGYFCIGDSLSHSNLTEFTFMWSRSLWRHQELISKGILSSPRYIEGSCELFPSSCPSWSMNDVSNKSSWITVITLHNRFQTNLIFNKNKYIHFGLRLDSVILNDNAWKCHPSNAISWSLRLNRMCCMCQTVCSVQKACHTHTHTPHTCTCIPFIPWIYSCH